MTIVCEDCPIVLQYDHFKIRLEALLGNSKSLLKFVELLLFCWVCIAIRQQRITEVS